MQCLGLYGSPETLEKSLKDGFKAANDVRKSPILNPAAALALGWVEFNTAVFKRPRCTDVVINALHHLLDVYQHFPEKDRMNVSVMAMEGEPASARDNALVMTHQSIVVWFCTAIYPLFISMQRDEAHPNDEGVSDEEMHQLGKEMMKSFEALLRMMMASRNLTDRNDPSAFMELSTFFALFYRFKGGYDRHLASLSIDSRIQKLQERHAQWTMQLDRHASVKKSTLLFRTLIKDINSRVEGVKAALVTLTEVRSVLATCNQLDFACGEDKGDRFRPDVHVSNDDYVHNPARRRPFFYGVDV